MKRDSNKSSTVLKAFHVLEAVSAQRTPASAAELARELDMDRVTVYRMLRTIADAGYLVMDPATKRFSLSARILTLAAPLLESDDHGRQVDALLERVAQRTGETCHYSELSGSETLLTRRAKGQQLVAVDFQIGKRCELHATSVGKAILAFQEADFIEDYMKLDLVSYTPHTIAAPEGLRKELQSVRDTRIGFDYEELSEGMNCVAVPVPSMMGKVEAGISISGPAFRLTKPRLQELADIMLSEVEVFKRNRSADL